MSVNPSELGTTDNIIVFRQPKVLRILNTPDYIPSLSDRNWISSLDIRLANPDEQQIIVDPHFHPLRLFSSNERIMIEGYLSSVTRWRINGISVLRTAEVDTNLTHSSRMIDQALEIEKEYPNLADEINFKVVALGALWHDIGEYGNDEDITRSDPNYEQKKKAQAENELMVGQEIINKIGERTLRDASRDIFLRYERRMRLKNDPEALLIKLLDSIDGGRFAIQNFFDIKKVGIEIKPTKHNRRERLEVVSTLERILQNAHDLAVLLSNNSQKEVEQILALELLYYKDFPKDVEYVLKNFINVHQ